MKQITLIFIALLCTATPPTLAADDAIFYLVRHAEKQKDGTDDPALTDLGERRAETLAHILKAIDFTAIYSTNYKRTMATAAPTAAQKGMKITLYDARPESLKAFSRMMQQQSGTYLIVGHSNTTPVVAGILSAQNLPELEDHQYDHLYIVTVNGTQKPKLKIHYIDPRTP